MKLLFSPLGDRVLVKRDAAEEMVGSVIVPDRAQERPTKGVIVAVGPGRRKKDGSRFPMSVKAGDRAVFARRAGADVEILGQTFVMMREEEILAVLNA